MIIGLFIGLTFVILVLNFIHERLKSQHYPPGPFLWPFIGNWSAFRQITKECGGQHHALIELSKMYGSGVTGFRQNGKNIIAVTGRKAVLAILNGEEYEGRPWNEFIKLRNFGLRNKGITMNDGPGWKELRGWFMRNFKNVGFGGREMSELIKDELLHVLDNLKEGGVIRIKAAFAPVVINVLWSLATGKRLCDGTKLQTFVNLLERRSQAFDMSGGILGTFPWIRYLAPELSGYNLLVTLNNELKSFFKEIIQDHRQNYVPGKENVLIDLFFKEMYEGKGPQGGFDDDQLIMLLMDLFLAGTTTTLMTLDFVMMNMLAHQEVQRQVHDELDTVLDANKLPDVSDRLRLPFVEAVLTESQRMWCVTPIIGPRRVLRDTKLFDYFVPKNTLVLMNVYSVNNDPEVFPQPRTFKPERFYKDGAYQTNENLILFGKGKRRCPGEILARNALFLLFVGMLQRFELCPVPGQETPKVDFVQGMVISPRPYEVLLVPRRKPAN